MEDIKLLSHMGSGGLENNILFRRNLSCTGLGSQMSFDGHPSLGPFQHIAKGWFRSFARDRQQIFALVTGKLSSDRRAVSDPSK